ncbi:MAG: hypothetical protein ACE5KG_06990 [Nitrososphaerales archaeon]
MGEVHPTLISNLQLRTPIAAFELDLTSIIGARTKVS